jgi:hypothetical protein
VPPKIRGYLDRDALIASLAAYLDLLPGVKIMSKGVPVVSFLLLILICVPACAQYKGDHIHGFLGLESRTQAPPGRYAVDVLWVYPTSTVKNANGDKINQRGCVASTADVILVSLMTNYKFLGANSGASAAIPFIQNRGCNSISLDASTGFASCGGDSRCLLSARAFGRTTREATGQLSRLASEAADKVHEGVPIM